MASVNNSLVKKEDKNTFSNFIMGETIKRKINETVGGANGQRFITSILSAVSINPTLQECEHSSIISAAFLGEALKLSPSPQLGQYYMVPFNTKTGMKDSNGQDIYTKKAQFQLGYKGYIQLALRSGYYKDIDVFEVREGEYLGRDKTTGKYKFEFMEDDDIREDKKVIGYMAYFEYLNGFTKTLYWSKEKMLNHADKYSQAFSKEAIKGKYPKVSFADFEDGKVPENEMWKYSSFWYKDFDGMAFKTMLRQLISKWGIMSIEMQEAYTKDMAVINENGSYDYIENSEEDNFSIQENVAIMSDTEINTEEQDIITNENKTRTRKSSKNKSNVQAEENSLKTNVVENTDISKEEINTNTENTEAVIEDIDGNEYDDPFAML